MSRRHSKLKKTRKQVGKATTQVSQWLTYPIRLMFLPFRAVNLLHNRGVSTSRKRSRSQKLLAACLLPFQMLLSAMWFPIKAIQKAYKRRQQRNLLYLIPAVAVMLLIGFVSYQVVFKTDRVQARYFAGAQRAIRVGNLELAKSYFRRLIDRHALSDLEALNWSFVLEKLGSVDQSQLVLDRLASSSEPGYPPAHTVQAVKIARQIRAEEVKWEQEQASKLATSMPSEKQVERYVADKEILEQLKFHLDHAEPGRAQVYVPRAIYLVHTNQIKEAFSFIDEVAKDSPSLYLTIATLGKNRGFDEDIRTSLEKARLQLKSAVQDTPLDTNTRYLLAQTLIKLERFDEAERALITGLNLQPSNELRRALAQVNLEKHEAEETKYELGPIIKKFSLLKRAISIDPTYLRSYSRMFYSMRNPPVPSEASSEPDLVEKALVRMTTSNAPNSLDHCYLAYIHWKRDDIANMDWHLEQAWGIDEDFGAIAHLIGLHFASVDDDIDWGLKLVEMSVAKSPNLCDPHLSLAKIQLKLGNHEATIAELECALKCKTESEDLIHIFLSNVLSSIGRFDQAAEHRRKADSIRIKRLNLGAESKN